MTTVIIATLSCDCSNMLIALSQTVPGETCYQIPTSIFTLAAQSRVQCSFKMYHTERIEFQNYTKRKKILKLL